MSAQELIRRLTLMAEPQEEPGKETAMQKGQRFAYEHALKMAEEEVG
jgi:hypothetical protein